MQRPKPVCCNSASFAAAALTPCELLAVHDDCCLSSHPSVVSKSLAHLLAATCCRLNESLLTKLIKRALHRNSEYAQYRDMEREQ